MKQKLLKIVLLLLLSTRATDKVSVEVAAYSPGPGFLTKKKSLAGRVFNSGHAGYHFQCTHYGIS